jgi:hypothetical protein
MLMMVPGMKNGDRRRGPFSDARAEIDADALGVLRADLQTGIAPRLQRRGEAVVDE